MKVTGLICCLLWLIPIALPAQQTITSADGVTVEITDDSRIITIGGSITETVYALGAGERVIATDVSSTHPPQVFRLPRVPYLRNLTSEGILSLNPTLIIASELAQPKSAIEQIRSTGIPVLLINEEDNIQGLQQKLTTIGEAVNKEMLSRTILTENEQQLQKAAELRSHLTTKPTVLFVLESRNGGSFMAAGSATSASTVIELAGATNAFSSFNGFKPVSAESILMANPDYLLVMETRLESIQQDFLTLPSLQSLQAIQNNAFVSMDGNKLLGFGPRFGEAILELMQSIHPELTLDY